MAGQKAETIVSYEIQESSYKKAMDKLELDPLIIQHRYRMENALAAADLFETAGDYLDAPARAEECRALAARVKEEEKAYLYERSARQMQENPGEHYGKLEKTFAEFGSYKEAERLRQECASMAKTAKRKRQAGLVAVFVVLAALAGGVFWVFTSGAFDYIKGRVYMAAGMYNYAMDCFDKAEGKFGSEETAFACKIASMREGKPGDSVRCGDYKWKVLENLEEEQAVLLIANNVSQGHDFRLVQYHDTDEAVSWKDSSLREWLNTKILNEHFLEEERERMLPVFQPETVNSVYGTEYPDSTEDLMALLSEEELEQYFDIVSTLGNDCWVRTPGNSPDTAEYISSSHEVRPYGMPVTEKLCVRPVIKVSYAD